MGFSLWCVITYNDWTAQRCGVSRGGNVVNRAAPFIKLKLIKSNVELLTGYWHNLVFDSELFFCLLGLLTPPKISSFKCSYINLLFCVRSITGSIAAVFYEY